MKSSEIFAVVEQIAATSSKNEKENRVREFVNDDDFKRVLGAAYNPFKTYGIRPVRPDGVMGDGGGTDFEERTWEILDALISRKLTGDAARSTVACEFGRLNRASADLLWRIIMKDLRAGFSESTINKAMKGLIPDFPYMRCSLPKDANLESWPWVDGVVSQEKADAMFANCDHEADGRVAMRSRQGTEFPMEKFPGIEADVRAVIARNCQLHGELAVMRDGKICRREDGNGVLNHVINGGDFAENEAPVYLIWDQIPLACVVSKGKYDKPYKARLMGIIEQLSKVKTSSIRLVPTRIVKSLAEARLHAAELMKEGKEGTVIKHPKAIWKDGTSKEQIKIKLEFEVDLKVVGIVEGRAGKRTEGRAGSFACETSDGLLRVDVTVKNEAVRDAADSFVGKIIAVTANDIMFPSESNPLHSLFLPRMSEPGYRTDKTEADSLQRVLAQKEAAVYGEEIAKEAA